MRRLVGLGALRILGGLSAAVTGGQQTPQAPLPDLVKVEDNLYMIAASSPADRSTFTGGNAGVFVMSNAELKK